MNQNLIDLSCISDTIHNIYICTSNIKVNFKLYIFLTLGILGKHFKILIKYLLQLLMCFILLEFTNCILLDAVAPISMYNY